MGRWATVALAAAVCSGCVAAPMAGGAATQSGTDGSSTTGEATTGGTTGDAVSTGSGPTSDSAGSDTETSTAGDETSDDRPPAPLEPWERPFDPLRTHHVHDGSCGGDGSVGDPECLEDARAHVQAGDLHLMRGGTYTGNFVESTDGTREAPIVWRGYVDDSGNPEDVYVDGSWEFAGAWTWAENLRFGDDDKSTATEAAFRSEAEGTALINSIIVDHCEHSAMDAFDFGSDVVIYNVTLINGGCDDTGGPPPHNIYTQNSAENGWKYYVQIKSLDTDEVGNRFNVHAFATDGTVQRMHYQDGVAQRGRVVFRDDQIAIDGDVREVLWTNMLADSLTVSTRFQLGRAVANTIQFEVTDSLFRDTEVFAPGVLGAADACEHSEPAPPTRFVGNRIWSPNGDNYVEFGTATANAGCSDATSGAAAILDDTEWDDNTYGPAGAGHTFDLFAAGVDHGATLSLGEWTDATNAARANPGLASGFDANSVEVPLPTEDEAQCFDNFYRQGSGYCWAIDWDGSGTVTLGGSHLDPVIGNGKAYTLRDARDFFGPPLRVGRYSAGVGVMGIGLPATAINGVLIVDVTSEP